jgi:hypothetical protein
MSVLSDKKERVIKLVPVPDALKSDMKTQKIKQRIVEEIRSLLKVVPLSPKTAALIQYVASLIESLLNGQKVDKWVIYCDIMREIWPDINEADLIAIKDILEHLLSSKMIKSVPVVAYCMRLARELLFRALKNAFFL